MAFFPLAPTREILFVAKNLSWELRGEPCKDGLRKVKSEPIWGLAAWELSEISSDFALSPKREAMRSQMVTGLRNHGEEQAPLGHTKFRPRGTRGGVKRRHRAREPSQTRIKDDGSWTVQSRGRVPKRELM